MDQMMPGHDHMPGMMHHGQPMTGMSDPQPSLVDATQPGQAAYGAIQEIVRILEADPKTDWSKVNLEALRQHLIDMNEVTLNAKASAKPIDGGLEIAVTGNGRTLEAIQRMVPAPPASSSASIRMAGAPKPQRCRTVCCSRLRQAIRRRCSTFVASASSASWSAAPPPMASPRHGAGRDDDALARIIVEAVRSEEYYLM